jgi:hypothetical protein
MPSLHTAALAFAFLPLVAQDHYAPLGPGNRSCPKLIEVERSLSSGGNYYSGRSTAGRIIEGTRSNTASGAPIHFPKEGRRDVSAFAVAGPDGSRHPLSEFRGKVVVVALWQTTCEPSTQLLQEIASVAPNAPKFGVVVLPVFMDTVAVSVDAQNQGHRWGILRAYVQKNKAFFEDGPGKGLPLYAPGLGAEGPNVFMDSIPSLPAMFIVDREGKLALQSFEYSPNLVATALSRVLREGTATPAPAKP